MADVQLGDLPIQPNQNASATDLLSCQSFCVGSQSADEEPSPREENVVPGQPL